MASEACCGLDGYLPVVHYLERVDYVDTEESCIPLIRGGDAPGRPKRQKTPVTGIPILHLLSVNHVSGSSIIMRLHRKNITLATKLTLIDLIIKG